MVVVVGRLWTVGGKSLLYFQKLSLAFNLEYLSQFFINHNNQWQFWNPHDKQSSNLSLVFQFAEELTDIIDNEKDEELSSTSNISTKTSSN